MIVDSSAVIAILLDETEASGVAKVLVSAEQRRMAAPTWLETCMVFQGRRSEEAGRRLETVRREFGIEVVPFDHAMAEIAQAAFVKYGKGSKHPAKLNFGDCMAYALAKSTGEPLLFKGDDFIHTDITPAMT